MNSSSPNFYNETSQDQIPRLIQEVVPKRIEKNGLILQLNQNVTKKLPFGVIESIALGAVKKPGEKSYLVIDLILPKGRSGAPRTLRMVSYRFNPRLLVPASSPVEAIILMVYILHKESTAWPLPSPEALQGKPFATFETLEAFENAIYIGESPLVPE